MRTMVSDCGVTIEQRETLQRLTAEARKFTKGSMDPLGDWIDDAEARAAGRRTYIPDEATTSLIQQLEDAIRERSR
jgi:hypothetical protein